MNTDNFLDILFAGGTDPVEAAAGLEHMKAVEAARLEALVAADAARAAEKAANRCPRCMGEGRLPQFQHRKGGECFSCGGTGIFTRLTH